MTRITGVLQLTSKTRYGMTSRNIPMYLFAPLNTEYPQMVVASSHKNITKNILVVAEQVNNDKLPRGQIVNVIGTCGDPEAERSAIHNAYSPDYWTKIPSVEYPVFARYLLDVPTINIDPPGCVDIDDCLSVWKEQGITKVAITIADVAEWVRVNPWMMEASKIGQTLYDNGKAVRNMFPRIVEEKMSLLPGEKRLGLSLIFDWIDGKACNRHFKETAIINKKSYTYDNVHECTEIDPKLIREIAQHVSGKVLLDPHYWVAELMIYYNRMMAKSLVAIQKGLLRSHSAPDAEKIERYNRLSLDASMFAYESAKYAYATEDVTHWGFQDKYCHSTSPIRRWEDVVNQMAMKGMPVPDSKDDCNRLQKYAKNHQRDLRFLDILNSKPVDVPGMVVSSTRIWVESWGRLISCKNDLPEGTPVIVNYFLDMQQAGWKKRLVFSIKTNQ